MSLALTIVGLAVLLVHSYKIHVPAVHRRHPAVAAVGPTHRTSLELLAGRAAHGALTTVRRASSVDDPGDDDVMAEVLSVEDEIRRVIGVFMAAEGGISAVDPTLLTDNAHLLAKGRSYEAVIAEVIRGCANSKEVAKVEAIDAFLGGFVASERKQRARLKLNYVIAGASTNRLDQSIRLLADSDEIDDSLLAFIDSMIKKEILRAVGPAATDDAVDTLQGPSRETIEVLRMIRRRLEAEMTMSGRMEVQLLSRLLAEPDLDAREALLRRSFSRVEDVETFAAFLASGVDHLLATEGSGRARGEDTDDAGDGNGNGDGRGDSLDTGGRAASGAGAVQGLPVGTLEKMRDLLVSVDKVAATLATGLRAADDLYSTNAEDYLGADLPASGDGNVGGGVGQQALDGSGSGGPLGGPP